MVGNPHTAVSRTHHVLPHTCCVDIARVCRKARSVVKRGVPCEMVVLHLLIIPAMLLLHSVLSSAFNPLCEG